MFFLMLFDESLRFAMLLFAKCLAMLFSLASPVAVLIWFVVCLVRRLRCHAAERKRWSTRLICSGSLLLLICVGFVALMLSDIGEHRCENPNCGKESKERCLVYSHTMTDTEIAI